MAILERQLENVNIHEVLETINIEILKFDTATLEHESTFLIDDTCCVIRVYERYSILGGNRLSLTLTLFGNDNKVHLSAITAGGSQAMIFKINTFGEKNFLKDFEKIIDGLFFSYYV